MAAPTTSREDNLLLESEGHESTPGDSISVWLRIVEIFALDFPKVCPSKLGSSGSIFSYTVAINSLSLIESLVKFVCRHSSHDLVS